MEVIFLSFKMLKQMHTLNRYVLSLVPYNAKEQNVQNLCPTPCHLTLKAIINVTFFFFIQNDFDTQVLSTFLQEVEKSLG